MEINGILDEFILYVTIYYVYYLHWIEMMMIV